MSASRAISACNSAFSPVTAISIAFSVSASSGRTGKLVGMTPTTAYFSGAETQLSSS
jgi:hypothetical protein